MIFHLHWRESYCSTNVQMKVVEFSERLDAIQGLAFADYLSLEHVNIYFICSKIDGAKGILILHKLEGGRALQGSGDY